MNVQSTQLFIQPALAGLVALGLGTVAQTARAQSGRLLEDPKTGDVYREVTREVVRPVVEERVDRQETMVYRPETVRETRPEVRTTYTPVTQMRWMPYIEGRWNPFRQPTVAYRQVPETRWEARNEVINRTTTKTQWVAEKRTVEIPHKIVRHQRQRRTDLELVARGQPQPQVDSGVDPAIAARLRPLDSQPHNPQLRPVQSTTTVASNTVGRMTSDPPRRSSMQSGMRTNVLTPANTVGTPLPPPSTASGIATVPSFSVWR